MKKGILRNFIKFTGNFIKFHQFHKIHLCQSQACNFIKKETLAQVFSCKFCEIPKKTFFIKHQWATASVSVTVKIQAWPIDSRGIFRTMAYLKPQTYAEIVKSYKYFSEVLYLRYLRRY